MPGAPDYGKSGLARGETDIWHLTGSDMITTNTGDIILDRNDSERLSKLIEWATQFVTSIDHITVQEAAQFIRDWKARSGLVR
jgi:phage gp45-like